MRRVECALVFSAVVFVATTNGMALTIQNASFEDGHVLADGGLIGAHVNPIPNWAYSGAAWGGGVINPAPADLQATAGQNVLWSNGGSVAQTLADTVLAGIYTLTVDVGSIAGGDPLYSSTAYTVDLLVNGSPVGSAVLPPLSASAWQVATVTATFGPGDAEIGGSLGIRLGAAGAQARFDSVALSYVVPEPASLALLTLGGLPLLRRRRL